VPAKGTQMLSSISASRTTRLGHGVPENMVLAYMWFNLAAAQGDEMARKYKDQAASVITREQIAEAQQLSREWMEKHREWDLK
jgi:TPR repeat protein